MSNSVPFVLSMIPEGYWDLTFPCVYNDSLVGGNELSSMPNVLTKSSVGTARLLEEEVAY